MRARKVIAAATGVLVALTTLTSGASAIGRHDDAGRFDRPQQGFASPWTTLRDGRPKDVDLDPAPIKAAEDFLASWTKPDATGHPHFSGAVGLLAHDGVVVDRYAVGGALRYADATGTELPADQQVPMRNDTIFDMASISKLFTSIAVLQLVERGQLTIDTPVSRFFPEFATGDKAAITIKMLLTHVSGFDADPIPSLWAGYPDIPSRRQAVLDSPLKNKPGTTYLYSDINLLTLGFIVEKLTGQPLDKVVHDRITAPLGMVDTGYNPPASKLNRVAATEFEANPPRGMVRGSVHDENAWSLGGVAGHAGVFSTATDMAVLAQTMLNGGSYRGHRILGEETVRQMMLTNYNQQFPDDAHGLGFELDQPWYMGALASPVTAGHTGFTGTTLVIDPESRSFAILLTNRVHPSRSWGSINTARQVWATSLARAMAVRPAVGKDAWTSTLGNASAATLSTRPFTTQSDQARVSFYAFVDTEGSTDPLQLQASTDGVNWQPIALSVSGPGAPSGDVTSLSGHGHRAWWKASGVLPQGASMSLRWRYSTDPNYTGRGVSVDGVKVTESGRSLLDGERNPAVFVAEGWQLSAR
ncbi:Beta-lactamase class C-like protein in cluster with YzbB [Amycolatopsis camponoti]|uniref:Beta-lactamase class C-like protein in cluster with YzbB n=1 Tax=Amycolatopsis camponoti TaxID=2606593 RepID=A0A6I8M2H8_9PSEU|nr:Beta-lactamase class C-like protein in cluster with YzbB [Amycolatopsis camponoti]